jgi:sirohydrochlorin cobaltochelatase
VQLAQATFRDGVILFAHGSRDPKWREPVEAVAALIRRRQPEARVSAAYLELCEPSLPDAAAQMISAGARSLCIFPIFFGVGKHAREDLPVLVDDLRAAHPGVRITLLPAAGEHEAVIALVADIALAGAGLTKPQA